MILERGSPAGERMGDAEIKAREASGHELDLLVLGLCDVEPHKVIEVRDFERPSLDLRWCDAAMRKGGQMFLMIEKVCPPDEHVDDEWWVYLSKVPNWPVTGNDMATALKRAFCVVAIRQAGAPTG